MVYKVKPEPESLDKNANQDESRYPELKSIGAGLLQVLKRDFFDCSQVLPYFVILPIKNLYSVDGCDCGVGVL